jgi:hypothetical protein
MTGAYEQAQRFLEVSPRPKLRKTTEPKPGQHPVRAAVHVTEDRAHHLALVRGKNIRTVIDVAGVLDEAIWSVSGMGYVIDLDRLPDVEAAAQHLGAPYRVKQVRRDA